MAVVRGGLSRAMEILAGEQARRHEVLVASPLPPRPAGDAPLPGWRPLALRGNSDIRGHLRLVAMANGFAPDAALLHAGSPGELALATALLARRSAAVAIEHAPEHYPLRRLARDAVLRRLKGSGRRWVSVSAAGARRLEALWDLPRGRIATVRWGVPGPGDIVGSGGRDGRHLVCGFGAPTVAKGYDTFRRVAGELAARFPSNDWRWFGGEADATDGPVTLHRWSEDAASALSHSAVLLVPSRFEGLPLVLLEAMAAGVAVVASRVGGVPEAVEAGATGLLVDPEDADGWAAAVAALLADDDRRRRMAAAGREAWQRRFSAAAMAERWSRLLQEEWRRP